MIDLVFEFDWAKHNTCTIKARQKLKQKYRDGVKYIHLFSLFMQHVAWGLISRRSAIPRSSSASQQLSPEYLCPAMAKFHSPDPRWLPLLVKCYIITIKLAHWYSQENRCLDWVTMFPTGLWKSDSTIGFVYCSCVKMIPVVRHAITRWHCSLDQ